MGKLLLEDPASRRILGAGRRAALIRARVRTIRKFLVWLSAAYQLTYPSSHLQLIECVQPCPRGSLKLTHVAFVFLEELSGALENHPRKFS